MKQIIKLYSLIVVSCLLLAGCNNDEDLGNLGNPVAVQFGMGETNRLRTTHGGDRWTQNDPVGIFMVRNGQVLNSANIAEDADNIEYKAQTGGSAISGFTPASGTPIFYPNNGDNVDFITYYPYKSPITNYTYPIDVSNQSDPADIDVLYSNNAAGYNKNSSTVDLQFNHALSKLTFLLVRGDGSPYLPGAKVEITNLATTADMDLTDGTVTATNSGQTLMMNTTNTGYISMLNSSAIVIPQSLSGTKLIITLADGSKFEWTFTDTQFEQGKNHQYTIYVNKTGITVSSSGITIWTGTGDPATSGTAERIRYQVGDYYPYPDDPSSAIGVVWEINPGGLSGKIVDLDYIQRNANIPGGPQGTGNQGTGIRWGDPTVDEQAAGVVGIRDMNDGELGTRNLIIMRKDQPNFADVYCLFNWIYLAKNNGNVNGMWYLPAHNELLTITNLKDIINPKTFAISGRNVVGHNTTSTITEFSIDHIHHRDELGNPGLKPKHESSWGTIAFVVAKF